MRRYFIETYGCQMNLADSEVIASILENNGWSKTSKAEEADFILVNTCTVRKTADSRVQAQISHFKPLKKKNHRLRIAVSGCLAQRKKEELFKDLPFIDFVVGPDQYNVLPEILAADIRKGTYTESAADGFYKDFDPIRKEGVNAWVSVMRGCDNFCTYCIVPHVRGRERSKKAQMVVDEIKKITDEGFNEVTLLGQNVNSYKDGNLDFPKLLQKIDMETSIPRVRFMTSHPKDFGESLMDAFADIPSLCEYIHLPVQAGSDRILKMMNRKYTADEYRAKIDLLRKKVPGISISTDIITGFPSETDSEFEETFNLVKEIEYDSAFMFIYSLRDGTAAEKFGDDIPYKIKTERVNRIIELQMENTKKRNKEKLGSIEEVLIEGLSKKRKDQVSGRTRGYKNVIFNGEESMVGSFRKVKITEANGWALKGELLE